LKDRKSARTSNGIKENHIDEIVHQKDQVLSSVKRAMPCNAHRSENRGATRQGDWKIHMSKPVERRKKAQLPRQDFPLGTEKKVLFPGTRDEG